MPISLTDETMQDLALARSVANGDEAALEALYACYADPLYAFICHHLDEPRSEVDEIWQETLMASLSSLATYRGQSRLFTWLCSIARHKMVDHCRRRGRQLKLVDQTRLEELDHLIDAGPLPEEILARQGVRLQVIEALASLPADQRGALVARYADGCSVEEIARQTGRTYKAVESLLARARAAMRGVLVKLEGENDG